SIFVRTPAIASTVFLKDFTAQVPRALEINLNDVDENSLNFTFHRSPVRRHEDCEVISLPSEISSTTYGTEYPPPRTAISESLNTPTDQSAIQVRLCQFDLFLHDAQFSCVFIARRSTESASKQTCTCTCPCANKRENSKTVQVYSVYLIRKQDTEVRKISALYTICFQTVVSLLMQRRREKLTAQKSARCSRLQTYSSYKSYVLVM
ncbi:unnamed protein product, partial [Cylicocyclus nassatus]